MSTQTLFEGKEESWTWDCTTLDFPHVNDATGDITQTPGLDPFDYTHHAEWYYCYSEPTCWACAFQWHGIYLYSAQYREENEIIPIYKWDDTGPCAEHCSGSYSSYPIPHHHQDELRRHDDTDHVPCRECEYIFQDGKRIEVPGFEKEVVSFRRVPNTNGAVCMHLECGHAYTDIDGGLYQAWKGAITHRMPGSHYYVSTFRLRCGQCFAAFMATFDSEDMECWECETPISWRLAYICKEAGDTPTHLQRSEWNETTRRHEKSCIIEPDDAPRYALVSLSA